MLNSQTWPAGRIISRVLVNKECFVGFQKILSCAPCPVLPCPVPDTLDSFLGIWHLMNLFWLGGIWKDWIWVFQQQLWDILVPQGRCKDHRTLWMLLLSKGSTNPHKLIALLCFSAVVKLQEWREESTLSGGESSCPRDGTGEVSQWPGQ